MLEASAFSGRCDGLENLGLFDLGLFLPMNLLVRCWRGVDIRHSYNKAQYLTKLGTIFTVCMDHELNNKKMTKKKLNTK